MSPISTSERIRDEAPGDEAAIAEVTTLAFAGAEHSDGSEPAIVDRLRSDRDLTVSLVAERGGRVMGHAALSPVAIDGRRDGWYGLGPVAVLPECQGKGVGSALIRQGLDRLRDLGALGCVVLGDPCFYSRFGFEHDPELRYPGPPARYFQRLVFSGAPPRGTVTYAPGFAA